MDRQRWPGGSVVACVTDREGDQYALLEKVLALAGLWEDLARACERSGKSPSQLRIAVKPNLSMMLRRTDVGTYTDPLLLIHLLRLLQRAGYENLTVVESQNLYGNWFENRSVLQVAARAGLLNEYRLDTFADLPRAEFRVRGGGVDGVVKIVDLTLDAAPHDFGPPVGKIEVGQAWTEADFRINFAKMKSHFYSLYSLAIKNVYGCLPAADKVRAYHCRRTVASWTARLVRDFPVHMNVVDGWTAADGWLGVKMKAICRKPRTLLAGSDLLAVDRYGASLMGLEAMESVMHSSLAAEVEPGPFEVVGDHEPLEPWRNAPAWLAWFSRRIESSADLMDFAGALSTGGHDPCFPHRPVNRGPVKRALYLLTTPVNLALDVGYLLLQLRRRRFSRTIRRQRKWLPLIARSPALITELSHLAADDLEELAKITETWSGRELDRSGHFLFLDGAEVEFRAALSFAVAAAMKVLEVVRDENLDRAELAEELKHLAGHYESWFGPGRQYAYCYR